ncbi:MAG TPA: hypothetical protein VNJ08_10055 [Bacteriovoracaceae bacterium]|nr:hypothetical protein [Bacteriovoracaceae bacterium]
MNSKITLLLLLLISACGVKGDPSSPKNVVVPSLIENYPDVKTNQPLMDNKKFR